MRTVGLWEQRDARVGNLSGGQRRRLDVGLATVGRPELLFLDEPTTGFDPAARREAWAMLAGLRDSGTTIFLTTHYMDEAEALADRAAVIVRGEVHALGTPAELIAQSAGATEITFRAPEGIDEDALVEALGAGIERGRLTLQTSAPEDALDVLIAWSQHHAVGLADLEVRRASAPIANGISLPLFFISGNFFPTSSAPAWLEDVASVFPVKPFTDALVTAFDPGTSGLALQGTELAIVAAWGALGLALAVRWFRWSPRKRA